MVHDYGLDQREPVLRNQPARLAQKAQKLLPVASALTMKPLKPTTLTCGTESQQNPA